MVKPVTLVVEKIEANLFRTVDPNIANPITNPPKDYARRDVARYWVYFVRSDTGQRLVYDSPKWRDPGDVQKARTRHWWERILFKGEKLQDVSSRRIVRLVFL